MKYVALAHQYERVFGKKKTIKKITTVIAIVASDKATAVAKAMNDRNRYENGSVVVLSGDRALPVYETVEDFTKSYDADQKAREDKIAQSIVKKLSVKEVDALKNLGLDVSQLPSKESKEPVTV